MWVCLHRHNPGKQHWELSYEDIKTLKKTPRGTFDFKADKMKGLIVARWSDNNVVGIISNSFGIEPLQTASRWSKKESTQVGIPQPYAIKYYNQTMGGLIAWTRM